MTILKPRVGRGIVLIALLLSLVGCSTVVSDRQVEYKRSEQAGRTLEVPPDLTGANRDGSMIGVPGAGSIDASTFRAYETERQRESQRGPRTSASAVLPEIPGITVQRLGDEHWLQIDQAPDVVWPRVVDFWQDNGLLLAEQDPGAGFMMTAWLENRADIERDIITNQLKKWIGGLYDAGTRDQFRVRLERGSRPGSTELYLTHFGMQEQIQNDLPADDQRTLWVSRPRDPGLEKTMLNRLMVHLGVAQETADARLANAVERSEGERARLRQTDGEVSLLIDEDFARAWRYTGLALDRVGFAVEDRDRSAGVYRVRYIDPGQNTGDDGGWLSSLAFWRSDDAPEANVRYQIQVRGEGDRSEVRVLDDAGQRDNSSTAARMLRLLHEQIR